MNLTHLVLFSFLGGASATVPPAPINVTNVLWQNDTIASVSWQNDTIEAVEWEVN